MKLAKQQKRRCCFPINVDGLNLSVLGARKPPRRTGRAKTAAPQTPCEHEWEPDGQTMTAVRWYCRKCGASKFT